MKIKILKSFVLVLFTGFMISRCSVNQVKVIEIKNGIQLDNRDFHVKVQFYADNIVRVVKWPSTGLPEKSSLVVLKDTLFDLDIDIQKRKKDIILLANKMKVSISRKDGKISYMSDNGQIILKEKEKAIFSPVEYGNEKGFHIQQNFQLTPTEGLYGLGQHQDGYMNYRNCTVKLVQTNTDAVTPFLISTQRYGILWDNYSKTIFDDKEKRLQFGQIWV